MLDIVLSIEESGEVRRAACTLCGESHDQQYVVLALGDGVRRLGEMCPRCLSAGPSRAAERALRHLQRVRERAAAASEAAAQLREQARRLHEEAVRQRGRSSNLPAEDEERPEVERRAAECEAAAVDGQRQTEGLLARASDLATTTDAVRALPAWPCTLAQIQEAEKAAILRRFPEFGPEELASLVDQRYRDLLRRAPGPADPPGV